MLPTEAGKVTTFIYQIKSTFLETKPQGTPRTVLPTSSPYPLSRSFIVIFRHPGFFLNMAVSSPGSVLLSLEALIEILRSGFKLPSQRSLAKAGWTAPVTSSLPLSHKPEECSSHSSATIALKSLLLAFTLVANLF